MNDTNHLVHKFHLQDVERQVAAARRAGPGGGLTGRVTVCLAAVVLGTALWGVVPALMG